MTQIPCFDELVELANQDIDAFEQFRRDSCNAYIESTKQLHHTSLKELQSQIDVVISEAETPVDGIVTISHMMCDSVEDMTTQICALKKFIPLGNETLTNQHRLAPYITKTEGNVIYLNNWRR